MITGEHKNQIDSIWDAFWSAGLTSSIAVLEQMTYLFFIKMLDDSQQKREANAQLLGGTLQDPIFKMGEVWQNPETEQTVSYEHLRWSYLKSINSTQLFNLIRNDVFVFIKTLSAGKDSAFSRYMANAIFMIPNERTLTKIVDGIDNLDMTDKDTMGDVYEYILGKMAASGTNGQFRTPRHIIRLMVHLVQPTLEDTICDPAMGSAGFISKTKKTELLFLGLFTRILKAGGRCASIVPDGVLFGSSKAHLAIRKELVDNQQLEAIISMPSGIFKPYSGVSTAILIFTKTDNGGTDNVWFYDMRADGYSLDDKRSKIEADDIHDIISR